MPNAARISDFHTCPMVNPGPVPHVGGPVSSGSPDVNVGYIPAARVGDSLVCVPATDKISRGSANVNINGKQAARIGDPTVHGGVIVVGCPTVNIGDSPQSFALKNASLSGAPFCEECERLKRENEELRRPPPPNASPIDAAVLSDVAELPVASPPALAAEKNDGPADPQAPIRRQAREQVAWSALAQSSPSASPAAIEAAVRGLDLDKPLTVIDRDGDKALQGTGVDGAKLVLGPLGGGA
jgi:uncharacterized Zn-binding protein involved in type VI secretion